MNVSLPSDMKSWVDEQVRAGGYGTTSEFFRELLREARQRQLREEIDRKLLAALDSGKPVPADEKFWKQLRRDAEKRLRARKARR